jgi:two-component system, cell cycle response regulator
MMSVVQELDRVLNSKIVPTPPVVMLRVMEVQRREDSGLLDLVEAVSIDPGLSAKIIAMANSAVYRRDREATTIERAVAQIGARSVVTMSLAHSIAGKFPKEGVIGGVSLSDFWRRSLISAVAARQLAGEIIPDLREEAFFVGLMAGLGRLALADSLSERYEAIAVSSNGWPTTEAEQNNLGMSSLKVTAELLRRWNLPDMFTDAIAGIAAADLSHEDEAVLSGIARTAQVMSNFFASDRDGFTYRDMLGDIDEFGIDRTKIDDLLEALEEEVREMSSQLNVEITDLDTVEILQSARAELIELTLNADVELRHEREIRTQLETDNKELERRALRDGLTHLPNRRAFDEQFEQHLRLRLRAPETFGKPLGLVLIDLDHFKSVNDTYGHQIGDEVLRQVAKVLEMTSRTEETVARYGGEEFIMIAPMATLEELGRAAERLRRAVELVAVDLPEGGVLEVTASFGVAAMEVPRAPEAGQRLIAAADAALYEAKANGRNCVVVAPSLIV